MKRPTPKVFLTDDLSLPRDNRCRFHLEALPWPSLCVITNNQSRSVPTNRENGGEEKTYTKGG